MTTPLPTFDPYDETQRKDMAKAILAAEFEVASMTSDPVSPDWVQPIDGIGYYLSRGFRVRAKSSAVDSLSPGAKAIYDRIMPSDISSADAIERQIYRAEQAEKRVKTLEHSEKNLTEANDEYKEITANLRAVVGLLGDALCDVMPKLTEAGQPWTCVAIGQILHKADDILNGKLGDLLTKKPETAAPEIDEDTHRAIAYKSAHELSKKHWPHAGRDYQRIETLSPGAEQWILMDDSESVQAMKDAAQRGTRFRIKRDPITRDWSKPSDVPGDVSCYLRTKGGFGWALIVKADRRGVTVVADDNRPRLVEWDELKEMEHSTSRTNLASWAPCTITEEAK